MPAHRQQVAGCGDCQSSVDTCLSCSTGVLLDARGPCKPVSSGRTMLSVGDPRGGQVYWVHRAGGGISVRSRSDQAHPHPHTPTPHTPHHTHTHTHLPSHKSASLLPPTQCTIANCKQCEARADGSEGCFECQEGYDYNYDAEACVEAAQASGPGTLPGGAAAGAPTPAPAVDTPEPAPIEVPTPAPAPTPSSGGRASLAALAALAAALAAAALV